MEPVLKMRNAFVKPIGWGTTVPFQFVLVESRVTPGYVLRMVYVYLAMFVNVMNTTMEGIVGILSVGQSSLTIQRFVPVTGLV